MHSPHATRGSRLPRRALKEDNSEEGEYEIQIQDGQPRQRGVERSRSIGSRRGARTSGGSSVSSNATSRSKSGGRSRSNSVGRLSTHRQRSRASMASPSKYGRGLRRADSKDAELDVSRRSTTTAATDDLSDGPSPLAEDDDDSNHHLRRRLTEMTDMAAVASPSHYRQRKQRLRNRLSNENLNAADQITISPCGSVGSKNTKQADKSAMDQVPDLAKDADELEGEPISSEVKESIDRQQRREQAALEEVMSLVSKTKRSSKRPGMGLPVDASDRSLLSSSSSGIPKEMGSKASGDRSLRRTQSLNVGPGSRKPPSRRSVKGAMSQKKERRDMVKSNLGMFVEDDH
ncbi:unnamed protein product [Cylindrotheca closterium]|uniref:Uncharacterized protein n=1 Tax=Cylindrotheca closterium TaxID=2856 RepID=A0AAD2CL63_9STRA|nr:unnamed protein product [Cylindrotheca closterium]